MAVDEFDYVVVGGGTAGAVVAARLSEDPSRQVCLIEAGPSDLAYDEVLKLRRWLELLGDRWTTAIGAPCNRTGILTSCTRARGSLVAAPRTTR